jgi:hypothetical protein
MATLKEYNQLTAYNNHNEAALVILKAFGTPDEVQTVKEIQERTNKRGWIQLRDQEERDAIMEKYRPVINLLKKNDKMETVLFKLIDCLPELDSEDEPLEGSEAVSILCQLWDEIKASVK